MEFDCIILYSFWWGFHCCPIHCDLFKIYCAPPNLGIARTWICRLNFAQRPIFSGLRFFNEPEISDLGSPASSPFWRACAQDFYVKKSIDLSWIWTCEPWILRWARYPETTEAYICTYNQADLSRKSKIISYNFVTKVNFCTSYLWSCHGANNK